MSRWKLGSNGEEMGYNLYLQMGYIEVISHSLKVDNYSHPPKRCLRIEGHGLNLRQMAVAIAIDPFQVVYVFQFFLQSLRPNLPPKIK